MSECDVLIIGYGLSGSLLAHFLQKEGLRVVIIDEGPLHSATRVAAGLMDAISGIRLTLAWKADTLIPFAKKTYLDLEAQCQKRFFFEYASHRFFTSPLEASLYEKKKNNPEFSRYYGGPFKESPLPFCLTPFGVVETYMSSAFHTEG